MRTNYQHQTIKANSKASAELRHGMTFQYEDFAERYAGERVMICSFSGGIDPAITCLEETNRFDARNGRCGEILTIEEAIAYMELYGWSTMTIAEDTYEPMWSVTLVREYLLGNQELSDQFLGATMMEDDIHQREMLGPIDPELEETDCWPWLR